MKKRTSFSIALSAVSCALTAIFLALGINVPFVYCAGYLLSSLAIMIPLSKDFFGGACLAWIGAALICLPLGGIVLFYKLFPYLVFFGPYPIVVGVLRKRGKNGVVAHVLQAIWCVGAVCATWAIFSAMTAVSLPYAWMYDWIYLLLIAGGALGFFIYAWLMGKGAAWVAVYVDKITRRGRAQKPPASSGEKEQEDVFEFDEPKPQGEQGKDPSGEDREKKDE